MGERAARPTLCTRPDSDPPSVELVVPVVPLFRGLSRRQPQRAHRGMLVIGICCRRRTDLGYTLTVRVLVRELVRVLALMLMLILVLALLEGGSRSKRG